MSETGAIKFSCEQARAAISPFAGFDELNACRQKLRALGLLGVDANGVGFGNVSVREDQTNNFYITGSGTGGKAELALADYARVVAYDFAKNWLRCEGGALASSESLTHAAVYESEPVARAVIHCHSDSLWRTLRDHVPTTSQMAEYGTPEMASEVRRLFRTTDVAARKIFVMGGHEGGIVSFGSSPEEAFAMIKENVQPGLRRRLRRGKRSTSNVQHPIKDN